MKFLQFLFFISIAFSLHIPIAHAQLQFQRAFGTEGEDNGAGVIIRDNGTLLLLIDATFSNANNPEEEDRDIVICEAELNGGIYNSHRFKLPGDQGAWTIIETNDGGYLMAADDLNGSDRQTVILRLNSNLNIIWAKRFDYTYGNRFHLLREDDEGNIFLGLDCFNSDGIYPDDILLKLDASGNQIWKRNWGVGNNDHIFDIHFLNNGNMVVVFSFWFPEADMVFICLNPDGETVWEKNFFQDYNYYPRSFVDIGNGETILVGHAHYPSQTFAIRFDADFNMVWRKKIKAENGNLQAESGIMIDNNVFFIAWNREYNNDDVALCKMDLDGNMAWVNNFGSDLAEKIRTLSTSQIDGDENGIYLIGSTSGFGSGENDAYLIKTNLDGVSGCNEEFLGTTTSSIYYSPQNVDIEMNFNVSISSINVPVSQTDAIIETDICSVGLTANFTADFQTVCQGDSVNFTDLSETDPTQWQWQFDGGTPGTSTMQNPENIIYNVPGSYDVSLIVSNAFLTDTLVRENYINVVQNPAINLGNDTTICWDQTLMLLAGSNFENYLWQDGSTDSTFLVTEPGIFWVHVTNDFGCEAMDTINVAFAPEINFSLGNDTTLCQPETFGISAPPGYQEYLWQDGSTDSTFEANQSGIYWVEITDEFGCTNADTIVLEFLPLPDISLGNDTLICFNQQLVLNAGSGFETYLWQDGSQSESFLVTEPGTYWVQVGNLCGEGGDTITINFTEAFDIWLGADTSFCYGHSIMLDAGDGFANYLWSNGSVSRYNEITENGIHWVQVFDSLGCMAQDSIFIEVFNSFGISISDDDTIKICEGEYIFLNGPDGFESYHWQDGSGYPSILADTAGTYWLEVTDENGCAARDSVELTVNVIPENLLGNDTIICPGETLTLYALSGFEEYVWHNGQTDSTIYVSHAGNYWVTVTDAIGCSGMDTITVSAFMEPSLGMAEQEWICRDDTLVLDAGPGHLSYLWNDGSADQTIQVSETGFYDVQIETVCGLYADTVEIILYQGNLDLGPDTVLCSNEALWLSPGNGYSNFLWSNGSNDSSILVDKSGDYWVKAFDGFCLISDTITIDACAEIKIRNFFSPNSDGYNDTFFAETENIQGIINFRMVIFNRWGRKVKTLNHVTDEWNGKINNSNAAEGVYFWECDYQARDKTGKIIDHSQQGSVTLMR